MSTWTNLRTQVRAELLARVEEKATGQGRTVADVVAELLEAYVKPATRTTRKARKGT
jgi:hypothetical protein